MSIRLRDGSVTQDPRLDRLREFDPRSRNYSIADVVSATLPLRGYTWSNDLWLDQGQEGACTEFAIGGELAARPRKVDHAAVQAIIDKPHDIYWPAQIDDEWPGGSYPGADPFYEGTSVLAAIRRAVVLGYYDSYRWAFDEPTLARAVGYHGPAILGIDWYEGMYEPDVDGFIHPTGNVVGGHCIMTNKISISGGYYGLWNSWGPSWGDNGQAKITRADMAMLQGRGGEACIPHRTSLNVL